MIKIKIAQYDRDASGYTIVSTGKYISIDSVDWPDWQLAVDEANRLHKETGRCFGVFEEGKSYRFTTSNYYANLPEGE